MNYAQPEEKGGMWLQIDMYGLFIFVHYWRLSHPWVLGGAHNSNRQLKYKYMALCQQRSAAVSHWEISYYVGNCENRSLVVQMKTIHFAKDIDSISMKTWTRRVILTISSPLSWKKYPKPIIWRYHENSGSNKAFIWASGKN